MSNCHMAQRPQRINEKLRNVHIWDTFADPVLIARITQSDEINNYSCTKVYFTKCNEKSLLYRESLRKKIQEKSDLAIFF